MDANFHAFILSDRRRRRKGVFKDCTEDNHLRTGQPPIDPQRATQRVGSLGVERHRTSRQVLSQGWHDRIDPRHDLRTNLDDVVAPEEGDNFHSHVGEIWRPVCQEPLQTRHKTCAIHIDFEQFEKTLTGRIECTLRRK